ncbi:hypothetical protein [Geomesophilobacter sediminis]|uniref:Uncharacterized protein n=1 Tax=Geomesophilobacter sediminis TaxID=2798584 RepID=A0A8J7IZ58_9BACT|nr:hypothetical protein [Geomesophilobacter sediminis]MBJ6723298.1 hypothetical protein [Geomesophilobacter sediminis]
MTLFPAIMMTITLTILVIMVPRMYMSWMKAAQLNEERDAERLAELLADQNDWINRFFSCGVAGLGLVWLLMSHQGPGVPAALTDSIALYVTVTLLLAIAESFLAQKVAGLLRTIPVRVKVREK